MEPLLIAGMYKSGTSWLLACLSAHPQCIGFREADLIKVVGAFQRSSFLRKTFSLHDPAARIQRLFGKSAWCHLPGSFYQDLLDASGQPGQTLLDLPPGLVLDHIRRHVTAKGNWDRDNERYSTPRNFLFFNPARLERLYTALLHAKDVGGFLETIFRLVEEESAERGLTDLQYYLFKGADQITCIDALYDASQPIKKIVIVRDGRDAAISAAKFRTLMRQRKAAWMDNDSIMDYFAILKSWTQRAAMVRKKMNDDAYYVLRYEDLNLDFHETFAELLDWLGMDAAPEVIEAIHNQTSFEAVTGRQRGEEQAAVIRKGAVREWAEVLSEKEKKKAWKIAGKQLRALGYPEY